MDEFGPDYRSSCVGAVDRGTPLPDKAAADQLKAERVDWPLGTTHSRKEMYDLFLLFAFGLLGHTAYAS